MANTYTQIKIHFVFVVKSRNNLIRSHFKDELEKYITGIVRNYHHKMLAIYAMPDHLHMLVGFNPNQSISDFVRIVKANTSKWVNERKFIPYRFEWQKGYGAFSYSQSQVPKVVRYIQNQQKHHRRRTFQEEYLEILKRFEVDYKPEYLFNWIE